MDVYKNLCNGELIFLFLSFEMREYGNISCVKIIAWAIVVKEGTNALNFYIFEHDAEYGTQLSAESGTKYHFINSLN